MSKYICLIVGLVVVLIGRVQPVWAVQQELMVCAAASLADALKEISLHFESQHDIKVYLNLAGSNTVRLQIEQGAPCDVFFPADTDNMDRLVAKELIDPSTVMQVLENSLVVIAPKNSPVEMRQINDIVTYTDSYISLADPQVVPAGMYAREVLVNKGLWEHLKDFIAPAVDVRAALGQVAQGQAALGIVYKSDALLSSDVKVILSIPSETHSPIAYPVGVLIASNKKEEARKLIAWLNSDEGQRIFSKHGFLVQ